MNDTALVGATSTTKPRGLALAGICLVLGVVTLVIALGKSWGFSTTVHWAGVVIGVVGFGISIYAQMTSSSTKERWVVMPGWILAGTFAAVNYWFAIS
ncbi:MAG TPA: hypothetical protein DCM51_05010 [Actinobacteria bacterium]|nr:hypothetical protein [Actinomycetota bacterium]